MSRKFLACVKNGGTIITKELGNGKYIKLCKTKAGIWIKGEVHTKNKK